MPKTHRASLIAAIEHYAEMRDRFFPLLEEAMDVDDDEALWEASRESHAELQQAEQALANTMGAGCLPIIWKGWLYRRVDHKVPIRSEQVFIL